MKRQVIKVVKRNKNNDAKPIAIVLDIVGIERKNRRAAVAIVNNWISERRENGRQEKIFSDTRIGAWKADAHISSKILTKKGGPKTAS